MRSCLFCLVLLAGCGSDDHPPPPAEPTLVTVVTENPVRLEIETKPVRAVKKIEVDLNTYEYKYRYEDDKDDDSKKESKKKDG